MTNQTQLFNKIKADGLLLRKEVMNFLQKQSHRSGQQRECVQELAVLHQRGSLSKAAQEMLLHYALRYCLRLQSDASHGLYVSWQHTLTQMPEVFAFASYLPTLN